MAIELYGHPSWRTARKIRPCNWCNECIDPGDRYSHYWGPASTDDRDPEAFDCHAECQSAIDREYQEDSDWITWGEAHRRGMTLAETEVANKRQKLDSDEGAE